jgi:uncharacterized membrane protein
MAVDSYSSPNPAPPETVCPRCETAMPASASFCPGCGHSMQPLASAERLAAASGYFTLVPAVVLLFLPAFRNSRFVRFHAWQSILLWAVFFLAALAGILLSNIAAAVVLLLLGILGLLGMFFLWAVLSLKAWQGERFGLPLFGQLAERLG